MNPKKNIPVHIKRRIRSMDKVINNMLPNMYPCDYYSAEHFIVGLLEEMRWFLIDNEELRNINRGSIEDYIQEYMYDELTEYYNEQCMGSKDDNIQESIRRILREETINFTMILRRVPYDDLEREFEESLDMASDMMSRYIKIHVGNVMNLKRFIDVATSILMDGIHHELYSTLPEDIQWYDEVKEILRKYYKDRIKVRYRKLMSEI